MMMAQKKRIFFKIYKHYQDEMKISRFYGPYINVCDGGGGSYPIKSSLS